MTLTCIYSITAPSGRRYIGSAVDFARRRREHLSRLRRGVHPCTALQRAFAKYGEQALRFAVVEVTSTAELLNKEQQHIDRVPWRMLYNAAPQAGSVLGLRHSAELRERMSNARKGVAKSADHRRAISAALKGRTLSDIHKQRVGAATRSRVVSESAKAHMRDAQTGRKHSHDSKVKRAKALLNRPRPNNSSGHVGVTRTRSGRWQAYVTWLQKRKTVGTFDTPEEASAARTLYLSKVLRVADDLPV